MSAANLKTPLFDWHVSQHARIVDFAGWAMPVQYTSIVEEHQATRQAAGLFDISHMGRLRFEGPGAAQFLDRLVTRRIADMRPGKIRYALVTNEQGGILDDVLVYQLTDLSGNPFHVLVVNAGNREKIVAWISRQLTGNDQVQFSDQTLETAMIAAQGPRALAMVAPFIEADVSRLSYYSGAVTKICGRVGLASRTGYTGEDGCELIVSRAEAIRVWEAVLAAGSAEGARPVGLGARDTLRQEAAMPLYGHELSESINPFQAGLDFAVNLERHDFIGRSALQAVHSSPLPAVRVGLELAGKRVAREHSAVLDGDQPCGAVTSGTFSPTLARPIAMAYVRPASATLHRELRVDVRGRLEQARVVKLPFYVRPASRSE